MRKMSAPVLLDTSISVASWDSARGVRIIDVLPEKCPYGPADIATQIFMTHEMFLEGTTTKGEQKSSLFTLKIGKFNRMARVFFEKGPKSFIIVLLVPDFFLENQVQEFDKIIEDIAQQFRTHAGEV
ncbi:MAG: hypothetical protein RBG13Loki_1048 [Promethearchaeota archaeon CR_4]|nr:MAG: hypothetical protein RBG13Loki_1048 [Candidatus Lokiarchaeota archaeon CR_4]